MGIQDEVEQRKGEFAKVSSELDIPAIVDFYEEDAYFFPPGAPLVEGRDALEARLSAFSRAGNAQALRMDPHVVEVLEAGDLVIDVSRFDISLTGQDGEARSHSGKHLTVWRRQPDGSLKIFAEALNRDA